MATPLTPDISSKADLLVAAAQPARGPLDFNAGRLETLTMVLTIALLLGGLATAYAAIHGLVRGTVYCKGGPYARGERPVAFWASVITYLLWTALMGYFAFFRGG